MRESREKQELLVAALQDRLRVAATCDIAAAWTHNSTRWTPIAIFSRASWILRSSDLKEILTVVQLYKALGGG